MTVTSEMWWLYELLFIVGLALYLPRAIWRRRLPHRGWTMRLGRYPAAVRRSLTGTPPVWIHAVSVGEVLAVKPLLEPIANVHPPAPLLLSTITSGGFEMASKQVAGRGVAIYFPLDLRRCVRRSLDVLQPRVLLLVESELWPTMIRLTNMRGIPIAVVNGRISPRTFRRCLWVRPWLSSMLERVDLFLMQSEADAQRVIQLGAPADRVQVVGSLKWEAGLASRPSPDIIRETAARLGLNGQADVIVAGSTHRGEEAAVLEAFTTLRASGHMVRLILAPRHLERLPEVEGLVRHAGFRPVRLSSASAQTGWEVGVVDTFGQLPRYYGVAHVTFIGGTLIPHGGQNPLEAASLGKPVIFGPSMHNFIDIAQQLLSSQAARQLSGAAELAPTLRSLFANRVEAEAMGRRALELTERSRGAVQRTLSALQPLL